MNKKIKKITMLFVAALIMVSCTTGNERKIVGIWKNDDTQNSYRQHPPKYMEFKKDGTVIIDEETALNYTISDDDLIIRSAWVSKVYKIEKLTSTELRLYSKEDRGTLYYDKIQEITFAMRYGHDESETVDSASVSIDDALEEAAAAAALEEAEAAAAVIDENNDSIYVQ